MKAPRVVWFVGIALFLVGLVYGIYWGLSTEGLAALGGPVLILMGAGTGMLVTGAAIVWSVLRPPVLPRWMLVATGLLSVAAGGIAVSIVVDAPRSSGFDLPVALVVVAVAALVAVGWGWQRRTRVAS